MAPNLYSNNNHAHQQQQNRPDSAFPMLVITVLSIIATAFLLLTYYIFVIKCCSSNWDHFLRRMFSVWRARRNQDDDPFIALSPTMWMNHGLDQSSCSHAFHLDCIDVWLQSNSNCPLCRSSISGVTRYPFDQIIAPSSSPQGSVSYSTTDSLMGGDEDFVVIELRGHVNDLDGGIQEREGSRGLLSSSVLVQPRSGQSPRKLEKKVEICSKPRKRSHVSIMGDECIDVREKDDQFYIEPIRRSFSLDSATGRQLYLTVKTVIQQTKQEREVDFAQECGRRVRGSSHSFRHVQGSRNSVFPI